MKSRKRKIIFSIVIIIGCGLIFIAGIVLGAGFIINQNATRARNNYAWHAYEQLTFAEMLREGKIEKVIEKLDRETIYDFWGSSRKIYKPGPYNVSQWHDRTIKLWQEAKAYYDKYPEILQNHDDSSNHAQVKKLLEKIPDLEREGTMYDFTKNYMDKTPPSLHISKWYGSPVTLEDLRGKVILLDFWGIWCSPCIAQLPHTQELYSKYNKMGFEVVGIHTARKADPATIADFLNKNNYTFMVGIDTGDTAVNYAVDGWPTYYLIDKTGNLIWGPANMPPTEEKIESLLKD